MKCVKIIKDFTTERLLHMTNFTSNCASVVSSGDKKNDKNNMAVMEKLRQAAGFTGDDFCAYTVLGPMAHLDAAPREARGFLLRGRMSTSTIVGQPDCLRVNSRPQ